MYRSKLLFIIIISSMLWSQQSTSQTQSQVEESGTEPGMVLEEITVVARKIQESLQRVPIAVTVLNGEELTEGKIFHLNDIAGHVPLSLIHI